MTTVALLMMKITILLIGAVFLTRLLRSGSAAMRHLVWVAALVVSLLLPLGSLMPENRITTTWQIASVTVAMPVSPIPANASGSALTWIIGIWTGGALVLLARLGWTAFKLARAFRRSQRSGNFETYSVRLSKECRSPAAWSFGNGTIVLPADSDRWPEQEREAALRHETAHLERKDSQALLIGELACAVYWFHPLAWYAAYWLRLEQEHAADDHVIQRGLEPVTYAEHLVKVVHSIRSERLVAGLGTISTLTGRVEAILDRGRRRTMQTKRMVAATALAAIAITLPLAAMQAQQQAERKVHKIGGDVISPKLIYKEEPVYTEEAREAKISGSVLLIVVIESDGRIKEATVERSLDEGLDKNAIDAVGRWQFEPAKKDGEPVAVSAKVEINFRLQ